MADSEGHDGPMRVLIVRPTALGDVCRTVPALVTLRRAMPDARIDWLVHDDFADAVRHHPDLDDVVTFPRRQLGRILKTGRAAGRAMRWLGDLRRRRYDLAIDLQGLFRSGLITRLTSAQRRVGYANAREFAWLGYNRRHAVERTLHTVDRMLTLLEADGYTPQRDMRLYVGDEEVSAMSREQLVEYRRQNVGVVFQFFNLIPNLTALENIQFVVELTGSSGDAHKALDAVGLAKRQHHFPHELSGGEQQRVALARAFATQPKVLLADEPTGNLDSENGQQITELLFQLVDEFNTTLVLITHDSQLAAMTDRQLVMKDGVLHED